MTLDLAIHEEEPIEVLFRKLDTGVRDARIELAKVQLELNLQITDLQLKAQLSTPPEVKKQHATVVTEAIVAVDNAVAGYTQIFE